jgi:hypothetical protein
MASHPDGGVDVNPARLELKQIEHFSSHDGDVFIVMISQLLCHVVPCRSSHPIPIQKIKKPEFRGQKSEGKLLRGVRYNGPELLQSDS